MFKIYDESVARVSPFVYGASVEPGCCKRATGATGATIVRCAMVGCGGLISLLPIATRFLAPAKRFSLMTVLKPGDIVVLKSGGPVMTVDTVNTDIFDDSKVTGILCAWFVGNKLERARFDRDAIVPAPSQEAAGDNAEPRPETSGEYKTVLDEMVAAMNDAGTPTEASRPPVRSKRASPATDDKSLTASAARGMN